MRSPMRPPVRRRVRTTSKDRTAQPSVLYPTAASRAGQQELHDRLLGAKGGSQVLVVSPGADESAAATVYVFDILGIVPQD